MLGRPLSNIKLHPNGEVGVIPRQSSTQTMKKIVVSRVEEPTISGVGGKARM